MSTLAWLVRDPLVHFLVAGAALFGVHALVRGGDANAVDERVVVVDRAALLEFVQQRSSAFEPGFAEARLDALSRPELARLVDDYVREEVLEREARRLGLDRGDYVIRRRLAQKLEFVARGFADAAGPPPATEVEAFFAAHRADYRVEANVTFAHVFFDAELHGAEGARRLAQAKLAELRAARVPFDDAPAHGDRFPYHVNYVERTADYVASHLGEEWARTVFALDPGETWQGPLDSTYGSHLVLVARRDDGREPALAEIRGRVEADAQAAALEERAEAAVRALIDAYDVEIRYAPAGAAGAAAP